MYAREIVIITLPAVTSSSGNFDFNVLGIELLSKQQHETSNNVVCATSKGSDQPAHTRSPIRAFAGRLNILRVLSY